MPDTECTRPEKWSQLPYAGELRLPPPEEINAQTWPMYYIYRDSDGSFKDTDGQPISWRIRSPETFDFQHDQLPKVQAALKDLTPNQIRMAEYWSAGPPTKQFTPIIDRLIDTYKISACRAARILGAIQAGINDTMVMTWHFKYLWQIPRPNQLDQSLATIVCTPYHPSYPAGHATVAGCAEVILSYFFPPESDRLKAFAEECAMARLYAGVHYPADNQQGLVLGRQIGEIVVSRLAQQYNGDLTSIDYPISEDRHADLMPPPYVQVISFPRPRQCHSILDPREDPSAR